MREKKVCMCVCVSACDIIQRGGGGWWWWGGRGEEKKTKSVSRAIFVNERWRRGRVCLRSTFQSSLITPYTPPPPPQLLLHTPTPTSPLDKLPQWHHWAVSLYIGWQGVSRAVWSRKAQTVDQHRGIMIEWMQFLFGYSEHISELGCVSVQDKWIHTGTTVMSIFPSHFVHSVSS